MYYTFIRQQGLSPRHKHLQNDNKIYIQFSHLFLHIDNHDQQSSVSVVHNLQSLTYIL